MRVRELVDESGLYQEHLRKKELKHPKIKVGPHGRLLTVSREFGRYADRSSV